jgi:hypothetical protein
VKDIKIELNTSNASGEAYWRKRCEVVEAEIACLRAENKALQADAALVLAVRRIPDMAKLWHAESRWYLHPGDAPCLPLGTGNSLEAALQAAGLMEVEK